jgi:hypothetical protein
MTFCIGFISNVFVKHGFYMIFCKKKTKKGAGGGKIKTKFSN